MVYRQKHDYVFNLDIVLTKFLNHSIINLSKTFLESINEDQKNFYHER